MPAYSSRATLTSFEGANGRPVFGLRRGRTAPMWQRCTPRALTRAYAHNGPWRLVRRTSTHHRRYLRPHLCVNSPERPCCWSCSSCDGSRTEELVPWCWTSSVHSISCLEVRTHASTRADRFASEAEARGSLGADLWITRSMKVGRRGDVDKPGARRDGHRSSLKRLRHYVHAYHGHRAEELTSRRPV